MLLEWADQNPHHQSQLLHNWNRWSSRIASICREETLISLASTLFQKNSSIVPYLKHLYTLIPSHRGFSQTKRMLQVHLWKKVLLELHKKTPLQQIAWATLEIAFIALEPTNISIFKTQFLSYKGSSTVWNTILVCLGRRKRTYSTQRKKQFRKKSLIKQTI